jgi:multicomponent Na+:H+ antiporter subunit F
VSVVGAVTYGLVALGALLTLVRVARGPSLLDRVVAVDTLLFLLVIGLGAHAAVTHETSVVTVVVAVSLLGFLGSVAVARYVGGVLVRSEDEQR